MISHPRKIDVAAVVVLFEPESDVVGNVASYRDQVAHVIAVDNSEGLRGWLDCRGRRFGRFEDRRSVGS